MANKRFEEATEREAMQRAVLDAMMVLDDEQWTVLYHHYFNRLPIVEVARVAGISRERAMKLQAQALRRLRQPEVVQVLKGFL